jgi:hypothetical protein
MFIQVLSQLSDEKKAIVRKLGFCSILEFQCTRNINDIFAWLINHFDVNKAAVTFENGFSFSLSPIIVYKILGIPFGWRTVQLTDSKKQSIDLDTPSIECLCSMLTNDLDETSFSVIFMKLLLSAFIAPNGRGSASPEYYANLSDVNDIPRFDWCTFTLNWLLAHIRNFQQGVFEGSISKIGECKIILVVSLLKYIFSCCHH